MPRPVVFGADYSVYVRAVRLALEEKGVDYDLVPVDVFAGKGLPPEYLERHPFARIPAFEHEGFRLYEAGAITRYVDEAFLGPALQPADVRARARLNQVISIADAYVYPHLVWDIYVQEIARPGENDVGDAARIARGRSIAPRCLAALGGLMEGHPWLAGEAVTLADLHLAPMIHYFAQCEGAPAMMREAGLLDWWQRVSGRESMRHTVPAQ